MEMVFKGRKERKKVGEREESGRRVGGENESQSNIGSPILR